MFAIYIHLPEFELTVYTGTKRLSGTDANVYVTFQGTERTSSKIKLVSDQNNQELFQRGSVDKFRVRFNDIGEILTMRFVIVHACSALFV